MSVFPKPYADLVARLRVTTGFVMVAAFAWLSQPTFIADLGTAGLRGRSAAAGLGHRTLGKEYPAGRNRSIRLRPKSAVPGNCAGGGGIGHCLASMAVGGAVRGGVPFNLPAGDRARRAAPS